MIPIRLWVQDYRLNNRDWNLENGSFFNVIRFISSDSVIIYEMLIDETKIVEENKGLQIDGDFLTFQNERPMAIQSDQFSQQLIVPNSTNPKMNHTESMIPMG